MPNVVDRLFMNRIRRPAVDAEGVPIQTERAIGAVKASMLTGIAAILLLAFAQPGMAAGIHLAVIGLMAATAAGTLGAIVGLIFGLPSANGRIAARTGTDARAVAGTEPGAQEDWYQDSSSLERIAEWLTGAVIALSLVNFNGWVSRFERAAGAISTEMLGPTVQPDDRGLDQAAARLKTARADAGKAAMSIVRRRLAERELADSREAYVYGLDSSRKDAARRRESHSALGGLIMAGYTFLGFVGALLWTRRYLRGEFARARVDERNSRKQDPFGQAQVVEGAAATGGEQTAPKSGTAAAAAAPVLQAAVTAAAGNGPAPSAQPGTVLDDPWKGQFSGGSAMAEIVANVLPIKSEPGMFSVDLRIRGRSAATRGTLAGTQAFVYLHPTFPDPIRLLNFDHSGEIAVPLVAYGAFTVGVELLVNSEKLELDLSKLQDAPSEFRLR